LVSAWSWSIYPAVSPVIDVSGFNSAVSNMNQGLARGDAMMTQAQAVQKAMDAWKKLREEGDKKIAAINDQTKVLNQQKQDAINKKDEEYKAWDTKCRGLDSKWQTDGQAGVMNAGKAADATIVARRADVTAYEKVDPYHKDQAKYAAVRQAQTDAELNKSKLIAAATVVLNQMKDDYNKCRTDYFASYQGQWRETIRADYDAKIAALGDITSISTDVNAKGQALMANANASTQPAVSAIKVMSNEELLDSFGGYPSKAYGGPTTGEYEQLKNTPAFREQLLARALNRDGPLAVVIDAVKLASYAGGVISDNSYCSSEAGKGNHALMLVGLQKNAAGQQYWVLKNSWGTDWGDKGYLYIARGKNICGIANSAARVNIYGDANDPISVQQDAQIKAYLEGKPSNFMVRA
jgi:hypothetical protein